MKSCCPRQEIEQLFIKLCYWSIVPEVSTGKHKVVITLVGDTTEIDIQQVQNLSPFIEQVLRVKKSDISTRTNKLPLIFDSKHGYISTAGLLKNHQNAKNSM